MGESQSNFIKVLDNFEFAIYNSSVAERANIVKTFPTVHSCIFSILSLMVAARKGGCFIRQYQIVYTHLNLTISSTYFLDSRRKP
jgi:hypothetical protein